MMEIFFFQAAGSLPPTLLALCFGLMVGSFLNVVIHRMPRMMQREVDNFIAEETGKELPHTDKYTIVSPRSACPHCGHKITALENIPVLSYLALRGKCRACKAPISIRYPIVELLTGFLSAWLIWQFGSGVYGLGSLVFLYLLVAMSFIDADTKLLPDDLTYPLLWIGLLLNINQTFCSLSDAVAGAVVGYMALWTVNFLFQILLHKQGMGNGDFKLLAALGAWFGWMALPQIILLASITGLLGAGISALLGKKMEGGKIPFGPFLSLAGLIYLTHGYAISKWMDQILAW